MGRRGHDRRGRGGDVAGEGRLLGFVRASSESGHQRLAALEAASVDAGRDPATIGKSAGIVVEPTSVGGSEAVLGTPVRGSPEEIADALRAFAAAGFTNLEVVIWPPTVAAVSAMAPVLELLDAD